MNGLAAGPVAKGNEHTSADKLAILFKRLDKSAKQGISRRNGRVPVVHGALTPPAKDAIRAQVRAAKVRASANTTNPPQSAPASDPHGMGSKGTAASAS